MVLGYFGKTPVFPDPKVVKLASEQLGLQPTSRSPLEINDKDPKKGIQASRASLATAGIPDTEENIFIAATCLEKGIAFLKGEGKIGVRKKSPAEIETDHPIQPSQGSEPSMPPAAAPQQQPITVYAPVPGVLTRVDIRVGEKVQAGQVVAVVDFMMMENDVITPREGVVKEVFAQQGDRVTEGNQIALIL